MNKVVKFSIVAGIIIGGMSATTAHAAQPTMPVLPQAVLTAPVMPTLVQPVLTAPVLAQPVMQPLEALKAPTMPALVAPTLVVPTMPALSAMPALPAMPAFALPVRTDVVITPGVLPVVQSPQAQLAVIVAERQAIEVATNTTPAQVVPVAVMPTDAAVIAASEGAKTPAAVAASVARKATSQPKISEPINGPAAAVVTTTDQTEKSIWQSIFNFLPWTLVIALLAFCLIARRRQNEYEKSIAPVTE